MLQSQKQNLTTRNTADRCGDTMDRFVARYGEDVMAQHMHRIEGLNGQIPPSPTIPSNYAEKGWSGRPSECLKKITEVLSDGQKHTTAEIAEAIGMNRTVIGRYLMKEIARGHVGRFLSNGQTKYAHLSNMKERSAQVEEQILKCLHSDKRIKSAKVGEQLGLTTNQAARHLSQMHTKGMVSRKVTNSGKTSLWGLLEAAE